VFKRNNYCVVEAYISCYFKNASLKEQCGFELITTVKFIIAVISRIHPSKKRV
jgi:hypothetical protein